MIEGADVSNLNGPPDGYRNQPWYVNARFVISQAIEPPPGFPGHDFFDPETGKRGYTGVQLRAAKEDGKYVGTYPWLWNGLADTRGDILHRLATVPPSVKLDIRPFVDTEDTTGGVAAPRLAHPTGYESRLMRQFQIEGRPLTAVRRSDVGIISMRQQNILDARAAADEWASGRGLAASGGYSGLWYEQGYLGGWWPDGWPKWWADYGAMPGTILGGLVVGHQYTSTPIDSSVLLESEILSTHDPGPDEFRQALSYLRHDVLAPIRAYKLAKVQAAVAEIDRVATQYGAQ